MEFWRKRVRLHVDRLKRFAGNVVTAGVAAFMACDGPPPDETSEVVVENLDTLVSVESQVLARPTELVTDEHGVVYVLDAGDASVHLFDTSGVRFRTIGREGSGPGELRAPRSLQVVGDTIRVLDAGNGRVQVFTVHGTASRTSPMPPSARLGGLAFAADGSMLVAVNGTDSALAQRFSSSGQAGPLIGTPITPPSRWNDDVFREEIRRGEVPAALRNIVRPVLAADGAAWILLQTEGRVQHYTPSDSMRWDRLMRAPEFAAARRDFFERNQADASQFSFAPLTYFAQGLAQAGDLWVLLHQRGTEPTIILVLDPQGVVRWRVRFLRARGIRHFAVDRRRGFAYLLAYDDATLLRARLPSALF